MVDGVGVEIDHCRSEVACDLKSCEENNWGLTLPVTFSQTQKEILPVGKLYTLFYFIFVPNGNPK